MPIEESLHTQLQNFTESKQWSRARDVIYEMLTIQPDSSWLHCELGSVLYHLSDFKLAEKHLKTAISHDPSYAEAYSQLAWVYSGMNLNGVADDTNKVALSLDPQDASNWILAFHLAIFYDNLDRAKECLDKLEYLLPESEHLTNMRTAYLSHPLNKDKLDVPAQIGAHEESLAQNPEFHLAHYQIAELHLVYTKDYEAAERHIKQALQSDPTDGDYQHTFAKIIRKKTRFLKILNAPLSLFESIKHHNKLEEFLVVVLVGVAAAGLILGENNRDILKYVLLAIIGLFAFIYPISKLYEYLTLSELFHSMNKVHLFKGPMKRVHQLSYSTRFMLFATLTLVFWCLLFLLFRQILTSL